MKMQETEDLTIRAITDYYNKDMTLFFSDTASENCTAFLRRGTNSVWQESY